MREPLVSVIIPNYNHSKYLEQRINSVLKQSFQNFELIILDDFSTDDSRTIIQKYSLLDKVSNIVFNDRNSGSTFIQWQKGFSLSKGKYIWIAESDDYSDISFLEKLVPLLEEDNNSILAYSGSFLVDDRGSCLEENWDKNKEAKGAITLFNGMDFCLAKMLTNNNLYNAGMVLFRRKSLDNIDNRFLTYRFCGDWSFWSDVCKQGSVIRYNEKLNFFRQHLNKITPNADAEGLKFIEGKYVIDKIMTDLSLSSLQRKVVIGKILKRISNYTLFKNSSIRQKVEKDIRTYWNSKIYYIFIYELDKILNFSHLQLRKNKYL